MDFAFKNQTVEIYFLADKNICNNLHFFLFPSIFSPHLQFNLASMQKPSVVHTTAEDVMKDICPTKHQELTPHLVNFANSNEEKLRYLKQMLQNLDMSDLGEADRRQLLLKMHKTDVLNQLN